MSKTYLMESIQNNLKESEDKKLDKIDKEFFQKEDKFVKSTFGKDSKDYKDYKKQHENKYGKDYIKEDEVIEEPKEQSLSDKFLNYTINVYDVDAFIKSETENKHEAFDYPGGAAIILGEGGKGCVADYEAIYTPFDSTDKEIKIPANDITEWKDGKRDIYLMPQYLIKTNVEEIIEKAPSKEMKASEFFKKYNYNARCQQNYAGMVKYLQSIGFFNQNESNITESAEDIDKFWSKGIKAGDNVESSGAGTVEIIDLNKGADYILLKRNTGYQPFVAAWAPQLNDEGKLFWGQGHYFTTEEEARNYFNSKVGE